MADSGNLFAYCLELLNCAQTAVTTDGGGAIGRAYVSPGMPPFDCCPQLTVHAGGPSEAQSGPLQPLLQPMHRTDLGIVLPLTQMTITVLRCVPILEGAGQNIALPSAAAMQSSAEPICADVWAIWHFIRTEFKAGTLFPSASGKREMTLDPASPVITSGGCAGWQIPVRVTLEGY